MDGSPGLATGLAEAREAMAMRRRAGKCMFGFWFVDCDVAVVG